MKKKIILLGAPGSGKGTIANRLKENWNISHISTGDMFREAVRNGSPMGKKAAEYMNEGKLVPDDITIGIVDERFSNNDVKEGYILDGFPRTVVQAQALQGILKHKSVGLDSVILLDVPEDIIVKRLSGRRTCSSCSTPYHVTNMPPKVEGICDKCGAPLIHRDDDKEDVIKQRLVSYEEKTAPLIDFYKNENVLQTIDASTNPEDMLKQLEELLH